MPDFYQTFRDYPFGPMNQNGGASSCDQLATTFDQARKHAKRHSTNAKLGRHNVRDSYWSLHIKHDHSKFGKVHLGCMIPGLTLVNHATYMDFAKISAVAFNVHRPVCGPEKN